MKWKYTKMVGGGYSELKWAEDYMKYTYLPYISKMRLNNTDSLVVL